MAKVGYRPWKIRHIDLSMPIPDLACNAKLGGLCLFFWWRQIPLGQTEIPYEELPLNAVQLLQRALPIITAIVGSHLLNKGFRAPLPGAYGLPKQDKPRALPALMAIQQPLMQLQTAWEIAAAKTQETVSVVICTRDRPEQLARCLQSLQALITTPHEIIVIDNAPSSTATETLVSQYQGVRYCCEPRPGLSAARNTGIHQATGSLIAFTDDDVEVHPYWIDQLGTAFQSVEVMAMTGLILPAQLDTEAEYVFQLGSRKTSWGYFPLEFDTQFFEGMKPYGVPTWRIGAGANMAFRREVFDKLGEFDERLGAGASGCSEDSEFWYRVLATGWVCRYHPTAIVYHYHRASLDSLNQQKWAYMRGHVVALLIQAERHQHFGNLRRLFVALPRYYIRLLILGFFNRFKGRYRTTFSEIVGCLVGIGFYISCRKSALPNRTLR